MAKQKKKVNSLSMLLDLIDAADTSIEHLTGKNISTWFKELQKQSEIRAGGSETSTPQVTATRSDPYAVLGLPPTASLDDVKKRYRQLSMIYHPDRKGGYNEAMKLLNNAYQQITKEKGK